MNYVTVTQLLEVGEGTVLAVHTHVLACGTEAGGSDGSMSGVDGTFWHGRTKPVDLPHYAWFNDKCNQELLVCIHEVLCSKSLETLLAYSYQPKPTTSTPPAYEFQRSEELRMLFAFKKYNFRQHIVLPDQSMQVRSLIPRASFITEHGKRVLPYLGAATYGSGFRSYRVLPEALHAFVDHLEVTSNKGIFKVLSFLDPKHKCSPDIVSYFKREDQSGQTEGGLAQVPLDGLKHRASRSSCRGRHTNKSLSRKKRSPQMMHSVPKGQSNILEVFSKLRSAAVVAEKESREEIERIVGDLGSLVIDEFFEFDATQPPPPPPQMEEAPVIKDNDELYTMEDDVNTEEDAPIIREDDDPEDKEDDPAVIGEENDSEVESMDQSGAEEQMEREVSRPTRKKQKLQPPTTTGEDQTSSPTHTPYIDQSIFEGLCDSEELFYNDQFTTDNNFGYGDTCHITARSEDNGDKSQCHATRKREGKRTFQISDDDIDMALFDIKTPELLSQQNDPSTSEPHSQTNTNQHVPITRSKSEPTPTNYNPDITNVLGMEKSKSDSVLQSHIPQTRDLLDDVTNTLQSPPPVLSDFDALLVSSSHGDRGGGWSHDGGCDSGWSHPVRGSDEGGSQFESLIDLTADDDDVTSEPSTSQCSQNQENKSSRRKRPPLTMEQILKGMTNVKDLTTKQMNQWLRLRKPVLLDIFKHKVFSQRHEDYISNPKKRAALTYKVKTGMFRQEQVELITQTLLKVFCTRHGKFLNYTLSVLLPECMIRLIADVHQVDLYEAEVMMFTYKDTGSIDLTESQLEDYD